MKKQEFLDFDIQYDTFLDDLEHLIQKNQDEIHSLLQIQDKTFDNFVKPLSLLDEYLNQFITPLSHLNSVCNSTQTQELYTKMIPIISLYSTQLSQNKDIYLALKQISKHTNLTDEQKRVIELDILDFELSGAHLDEDTKTKLQDINLELDKLSNQFSQNLLDATDNYEYIIDDEDDISNLPQSDKNIISFQENGKTKYKLTLQIPIYLAYMTYGTNRTIREELYKAYTTRAPQNAKLIDEILRLRFEKANLLGFQNYAQYSIASKMAPSYEKVSEFLQKLADSSMTQAKKELNDLQAITPIKLQSYDIAFYSEILKQQKHNIDQEIYRPYFEQTKVVEGLFQFLYQIFGVTCKHVDIKLWDPKAKAYDIFLNNQLKARIYLDLESRKNKRDGAWMHNWQTHGVLEDNTTQLASAFIVCNFPSSDSSNPSLLRHDDVVTLFHETGHAIHHILSDVKQMSVSGVNGVQWDAVEYPSQFLENFAYEPSVLKLFAKHYKTNKVLPDKLIKQLIDAKNFQSALSMLRQLEFAMFDLEIHSKLYQGEQIQILLDNIRKNTALIKPPSYNKFQNGFSHIFAGGYAAGYYSYKWAEVLSADTFYQIVDEGIFNSKTAEKYLDIILKKGGSYNMYELFEQLMKREPEIDSLLRLNGIN